MNHKLIAICATLILTFITTPFAEAADNEMDKQLQEADERASNPEANKQLMEAVEIGDGKAAIKALKSGADINSKNDNGFTVLHLVAEKGYSGFLRMLINRSKSKNIDINIKDSLGRTPLHCAVEKGHTNIVKLLIRSADIYAKDESGQTAYQYATSHGLNKCAKILLNRQLEKAARDGDIDAIKMGLRNGGDINHRDYLYGNNLLHMAALFGHTAIARLLINNGINVNSGNLVGITPLYYATEGGHTNVLKLLIDRGANVNVDVCVDTPLHMSLMNGFKEIVYLLLNADAKLCGHHDYTHLELLQEGTLVLGSLDLPAQEINDRVRSKKQMYRLLSEHEQVRAVTDIYQKADEKNRKTAWKTAMKTIIFPSP